MATPEVFSYSGSLIWRGRGDGEGGKEEGGGGEPRIGGGGRGKEIGGGLEKNEAENQGGQLLGSPLPSAPLSEMTFQDQRQPPTLWARPCGSPALLGHLELGSSFGGGGGNESWGFC